MSLDSQELVLSCFRSFAGFIYLYWVVYYFSFFINISQVIGCQSHLQNDINCIRWGIKLLAHSLTPFDWKTFNGGMHIQSMWWHVLLIKAQHWMNEERSHAGRYLVTILCTNHFCSLHLCLMDYRNWDWRFCVGHRLKSDRFVHYSNIYIVFVYIQSGWLRPCNQIVL